MVKNRLGNVLSRRASVLQAVVGASTGLLLCDDGDVFRQPFEQAGRDPSYSDSEFPLPVRAQCEAGARLLLVPSCTDTEVGATRVGCLVRALENRMIVAQSLTAGLAECSPALDVNTVEATIYAPMDAGFPSDGVLVQTQEEQVWALAELPLRHSRAAALVPRLPMIGTGMGS